MKALHDLGEYDAKGFGWWFVVASEPATACAGIDAREVRKVEFGFVRPRETREIAEVNPMAIDVCDPLRRMALDTFV